MLAHGLCSSGLFYLCGQVYNLTGSRRLCINKGLLVVLPGVSLWWFLLVCCNASSPPTLNLLSEIELISCLVSYRGLLSIPLSFIVFIRCAYGVYVYLVRQHGRFVYQNQGVGGASTVDYLVLFSHWLPINLLVLYVYFLLCFFSL